jgi:catechol 2,3-dioxygenase-like lactoylglutathione lyase family enzyme
MGGVHARHQHGRRPLHDRRRPGRHRLLPTHLGFTVEQDAAPAFAAVSRDGVRLLLSGPTSSGRRPMPDGTRPVPGGWNRLHLQVADLAAEVERLRAAGCRFRNDIITGPGGSQTLLQDPSGNLVELFQPAG